MSASFVSGEIGSVADNIIVITFSEAVNNDIVNGVTIRKNGTVEPFTAERQSNHAIIYYTISTCDSDDVISWEYSTVLPNVMQNNFAWTNVDFRSG